VLELDGSGNTRTGFGDCSDICESMDGTEIDGVSFLFSQSGNLIEITMESDSLSEGIKPNYPKRPLSPVSQVSFKSPEAKFTANTLNKLIRRIIKEFPSRAIFIRDVKELIE